MWAYFETTLIPGLSDNGTQYVIDKINYLIGPARIRQIRELPVNGTVKTINNYKDASNFCDVSVMFIGWCFTRLE